MAKGQMRLDEETAGMVEELRAWQRENLINTSEAEAARMLVKWGFRDWKRMRAASVSARKENRK